MNLKDLIKDLYLTDSVAVGIDNKGKISSVRFIDPSTPYESDKKIYNILKTNIGHNPLKKYEKVKYHFSKPIKDMIDNTGSIEAGEYLAGIYSEKDKDKISNNILIHT